MLAVPRQEDYLEFEASLCYIVRSKPTWAIEGELVSKNEQTNKRYRLYVRGLQIWRRNTVGPEQWFPDWVTTQGGM